MEENTAPVEDQQASTVDGGDSGDEAVVAEFEQFMNKGEEPSEEPSTEPAPEAEPKTEPEPQPKEEPVEAPQWWSKEEKDAFSKASPEVQKAFWRRADQVEQLAREASNMKSFAAAMDPVAQVIGQHGDYLKQARIDGKPLAGNPNLIAAEIDSLFQLKQSAYSDPKGFVSGLVDFYAQQGIDFSQLVQQAQSGESGGRWVDPELAQLKAQLEELKTRENQRVEQSRAYQQRAQLESVAHGVVSLADEKGADGQSVYPYLHGEHATAIGTQIGTLLRQHMNAGGQITKDIFERAYKTAVYANDATRQAEIDKAAEQRVAQFKTNSQRAKAARGVVPASNVSGGGEEQDLDAAMNEVWEQFTRG